MALLSHPHSAPSVCSESPRVSQSPPFFLPSSVPRNPSCGGQKYSWLWVIQHGSWEPYSVTLEEQQASWATGQPLFGIFCGLFNIKKVFSLTQQTVVKSIVYTRLPKNEATWNQERDLIGSAPQTSHPSSAEGASWPDKLRLLWGRTNCWLNSKMTVWPRTVLAKPGHVFVPDEKSHRNSEHGAEVGGTHTLWKNRITEWGSVSWRFGWGLDGGVRGSGIIELWALGMLCISVLRAVAMVRFMGYKLYNKTCGLDGLSNSHQSSEFWKLISLLLTRTLTSYRRLTPGTTQH